MKAFFSDRKTVLLVIAFVICLLLGIGGVIHHLRSEPRLEFNLSDDDFYPRVAEPTVQPSRPSTSTDEFEQRVEAEVQRRLLEERDLEEEMDEYREIDENYRQ